MGYSIFAKSLLSVIKVVLFSSVNWSLFCLKRKAKFTPQMKVDILVYIKHITTNIKQHLNLTDFTIVRAFDFSSQARKSSSKAACEGTCSSSFATYSLKNSQTNSISSTQDKARNVWWQTFLPRSIVLLGSNSSFRDNASLWSLVIESNQLEKGVGTKKFLHFFPFFGKIRSAWCVILVKLYFLRLHVQLSSPLETYLLSLVTNVVPNEMGRLALPLLASKSFDSIARTHYLKSKGFAFCWFNTKLFGRTSSAKLFYQ